MRLEIIDDVLFTYQDFYAYARRKCMFMVLFSQGFTNSSTQVYLLDKHLAGSVMQPTCRQYSIRILEGLYTPLVKQVLLGDLKRSRAHIIDLEKLLFLFAFR